MTSHSEDPLDALLDAPDPLDVLDPPEEFRSIHKQPPEFAKPEPVTNTLVDAPSKTTPPVDRLFDDVMVDIETMSLHPSNALILSIGLVEFNPSGDELVLGRQLLITPSLAHQLLIGRRVDRDTQKFWLSQNAKAADHWLHAEARWSLKATALALKTWLSGKKRVWANGFLFDLGNLVSLCEQADEQTPWHYRAPRDARTFWEQTPITRAATEIGDALDFADEHKIVPHEPLSDCITQAHRVWQHWPNTAPKRAET